MRKRANKPAKVKSEREEKVPPDAKTRENQPQSMDEFFDVRLILFFFCKAPIS